MNKIRSKIVEHILNIKDEYFNEENDHGTMYIWIYKEEQQDGSILNSLNYMYLDEENKGNASQEFVVEEREKEFKQLMLYLDNPNIYELVKNKLWKYEIKTEIVSIDPTLSTKIKLSWKCHNFDNF